MDAMGKDIIIVETVGVGQDEVDIVNTAHTSGSISVSGRGLTGWNGNCGLPWR